MKRTKPPTKAQLARAIEEYSERAHEIVKQIPLHKRCIVSSVEIEKHKNKKRPKKVKGEKLKISVMFKTPDAVEYATENVPEEDIDRVQNVLEKFVKYGECVTIEFDIDNETASVLKCNQ